MADRDWPIEGKWVVENADKFGILLAGVVIFLGYVYGNYYLRAWRLKQLFKQPFAEANECDSNHNVLPFLPPKSLQDALETIPTSWGVNVLWGVPGSGKTRIVQQTLKRMKQENRIAGIRILRPPDNVPDVREFFRGRHGLDGILHPNENLTHLIPSSPKPFVIVIDQAELLAATEPLEYLLKGLGTDSGFCKSFVVLMITQNAEQAVTMVNWDSSRISPLGGRFFAHKWTPKDIDEWIERYSSSATSPDKKYITDKLKKHAQLAYQAATPGFLVKALGHLRLHNDPIKLFQILEQDSLKDQDNWRAGLAKLSQ